MQALLSSLLFACALALPTSNTVDLDPRAITVYGQGQSQAINAPGVAAKNTYKGFPNRGSGPRYNDFWSAKIYSNTFKGSVPDGVNPPQCKPKAGQVPVILIPGTTETAFNNFAYLGPKLVDEGLCVYSFNHNPLKLLFSFIPFPFLQDICFMGDIPQSAKALDVFIQEVLELTGASQVDIVGHSQGGGALPYYYIKNYMDRSKPTVRKMIGLAPSLGTTAQGIKTLLNIAIPNTVSNLVNSFINGLFNAGSLLQQVQDSNFMKELWNGGLAVGNVIYVNILTKYDNVVTPYTNSIWEQKGHNVTTQILQNFCSEDYSDHLALTYSYVAYQLVRNNLLDRPGQITCAPNSPVKAS